MEAGASTPLHSPGARALGVGAMDSEAVAVPGEEEGLEGGGHPQLSVCHLLAEPQGSVFELWGRLSSPGLRSPLLAVLHWVSANILFVDRTRLLNTKRNKNVKNRYPPLSRIREGRFGRWFEGEEAPRRSVFVPTPQLPSLERNRGIKNLGERESLWGQGQGREVSVGG